MDRLERLDEELEQKISKHPVIEILTEALEKRHSSIRLAGGAIIDILEGREPKDWDFINVGSGDVQAFVKFGFKFLHKTRTATTYILEGKNPITVQLLTKQKQDFDFTISQCVYNFKNGEVHIDKTSFENKILIPSNFEVKANVMNSLRRAVHWRKKGYTLPDKTYLSLLNSVSVLGGEES